MNNEYFLLKVTIISMLGIYALIQILYMRRKFLMHRRENQLERMGHGPCGSELRYSVCLADDGKTLVSEKVKSASWYSRLI